jgi:hypothetical protein
VRELRKGGAVVRTSLLFNMTVGLLAGNFCYQYFGAGDWAVALERSWFQFCALLVAWGFGKAFP